MVIWNIQVKKNKRLTKFNGMKYVEYLLHEKFSQNG